MQHAQTSSETGRSPDDEEKPSKQITGSLVSLVRKQTKKRKEKSRRFLVDDEFGKTNLAELLKNPDAR